MSSKGAPRDLNSAVLRELRAVVGNDDLRHRNIVAWSRGPVAVLETGEQLVHLPSLNLNVCYRGEVQ